MSSATATPQGLACLMTTAAGSLPSDQARRQAASVSYTLRYDISLPPCCTADSHQPDSPRVA